MGFFQSEKSKRGKQCIATAKKEVYLGFYQTLKGLIQKSRKTFEH